jgi:DNA-binding NtrC family response regulator
MPLRILVIDDEQDFRLMLTEWLTLQGHEAEHLADGPAILELLEKRQFDVILLDLVMPKTNGLTLLADIRRLYPQTRVIVVSAALDIRIAVEATKGGAEACITKPVDFALLRYELARLRR